MILVGDCVELMAAMPDASVDAVVCDPPYGLEFMGKAWDRLDAGADVRQPFRGEVQTPDNPYGRSTVRYGYNQAPQAMQTWHEAWATEALRVLKPGGHLLAFGGTRTYHRLACAVEDAGFEIRDTICWLYGSGFPKSLDVSKAIDKAAGVEREASGPPEQNWGASTLADGKTGYGDYAGEWQRTAPATPEAERWQGWGTALKPAHEPIVVARKPLAGTVAANVLEFGVGALNIDGTRISSGQRPTMGAWGKDENLCASCAEAADNQPRLPTPETEGSIAPSDAELTQNGKAEMHPGDTFKTATGSSSGLSPEEPSTAPYADTSLSIGVSGSRPTDSSPMATSFTTSTATARTTESRTCDSCGAQITPRSITEASQSLNRWPSNVLLDEEAALGLGEVARYFYVAKASRAERNAGLEGFAANLRPTLSNESGRRYNPVCTHTGKTFLHCDCGSCEWKPDEQPRQRNHHPTVKPVALMRWLVRLVTPPGGLVLDPFAGSGTTGIAAALEGFEFTGCEQDADYAKIAEARIAWWAEYGEEALRIVAEREKAEAERESVRDAGQLELL